MNTLAKALATAIHYIAAKNGDEDMEVDVEDDDVDILEQFASLLQDASMEERNSLINAARELGHPELPDNLGLHN